MNYFHMSIRLYTDKFVYATLNIYIDIYIFCRIKERLLIFIRTPKVNRLFICHVYFLESGRHL